MKFPADTEISGHGRMRALTPDFAINNLITVASFKRRSWSFEKRHSSCWVKKLFSKTSLFTLIDRLRWDLWQMFHEWMSRNSYWNLVSKVLKASLVAILRMSWQWLKQSQQLPIASVWLSFIVELLGGGHGGSKTILAGLHTSYIALSRLSFFKACREVQH